MTERVGLDADPAVLDRARAKAADAEEARLVSVERTGRLRTVFGTMAFYRGEKPVSAA